MNSKKVFFIISVMFLAACTTTKDAITKISIYQGHNVDNFFRVNGMPAQVYQFSNGEKVYRWSSAIQSVHMPAITTYSGTVNSFGQVSGSSFTSGGYSSKLQCVIDLYTDKDNNIIKISSVVDTWGAWQTSRCNEILR